MRTIVVKYGQTLEDVALEHYGSLDGVVLILEDNNLSMDDLLYPGQEILVQDPLPDIDGKNAPLARALADQSVSPNSSMPGTKPSGLYVEDGYVEDGYILEE